MYATAFGVMEHLVRVKRSGASGWSDTTVRLLNAAKGYDLRHDLSAADLKGVESFSNVIQLRQEEVHVLRTAQGLAEIFEADVVPWLITLSMRLSFAHSTAYIFDAPYLREVLVQIQDQVSSLGTNGFPVDVLSTMFEDEIVDALVHRHHEPFTGAMEGRG